METLTGIQDRTFAAATPATAGSYPAADRLGEDELTAFLGWRAFAVVSTARPDGRPHAAISSFACTGTTFWLPTGGGTVRERNIATQPWVSLVISEGDRGEHVLVIAEGPAEIVASAEVPPQAQAAASGQWAAHWIKVRTERLLSYGADRVRARVASEKPAS